MQRSAGLPDLTLRGAPANLLSKPPFPAEYGNRNRIVQFSVDNLWEVAVALRNGRAPVRFKPGMRERTRCRRGERRYQFGCYSGCSSQPQPLTENSYNDFYSECRFRLQTRKLLFYPSLINKFVRRRAERNPQRFEKSWTWALPAWYLYFELVVVKPGVHAPAAPKAEAYVQH